MYGTVEGKYEVLPWWKRKRTTVVKTKWAGPKTNHELVNDIIVYIDVMESDNGNFLQPQPKPEECMRLSDVWCKSTQL